MTASERRLLEFLGGRLEAMLHRPDQWGPPLVVEQLVLQLLEMRALVLDPAAVVNQKHRIIRSFVRFMKENVPDATPEPLAVQLERQGREAEFANILQRFVDRELIEATGEQLQAAEAMNEQEQPGDPAVERAERLLELFEGKARARMRRAAPPRVDAVDLGGAEIMSKTRGQSQVEFLRDVAADGGRIVKAEFSLNRDMWKDVSPTYYLTLDQKGVRSHQEFPWTPELEKYLLQAGVTAASPEEEAERFATILINNLTRAQQDHGKDYARSVLIEILRGRPEYGLDRLLARIPAYRPSQSGTSFAACTEFLTTSIDGLQHEARIGLRYSPDQARDLMRAALEILLDETFLISPSDAVFPRS